MRWPTHHVGAVVAALLLHLSAAGVAAAYVGGILPDVFDQKLSGACGKKNRQRVYGSIHRGFTHWWGLWIIASLVSLILSIPGIHGELVRQLCFGCSIGGLSHVLLDMLNPRGVPLLPFSSKNRLSLKVCTTGSTGEYVILILMLVGLGLYLHTDLHRIITAFIGGRF